MINQGNKSHTLRCAILVIAFLLLSACAEDGSVLFEREGCIQCHSFKGQGGNMAPDLTAVTNRRSDRWLKQQIKNPRKNNPDSRMPAFEHLSGSEISAILRYLKS